MRSLRTLLPSLSVLKSDDGHGSSTLSSTSAASGKRARTREQALVEKLIGELMPGDLAREIDVWVRRTAPSPAGLARREQAGLELRAATAAAYERVSALLPILTAEVTADRARRNPGTRTNVRARAAEAESKPTEPASPGRAPRSEVAPGADFAVWSRLVRRDTRDPLEGGTSSHDVAGVTVPHAAPDLHTLAERLEPEVKATIAAATAAISNDSVRSAFEAWMIRVHSGPSPDA
ncbi:MAG: hypothetical protein IV100_27100 [Myxococcales bacterium]|nr:hypothetical protein [Myxococcales bacterium]